MMVWQAKMNAKRVAYLRKKSAVVNGRKTCKERLVVVNSIDEIYYKMAGAGIE